MIDWQTYYEEALDALEQAIINASVQWGTDPEGNPWVIVGDRTTTGLEYPAAFIPSFSKSRDDTESSRQAEWAPIEATILVVQKGDIKEPEANLREALRLCAQVENSIYADRSLGGTVERATVTGTTPFAGVGTDDGNLEGGEINVRLRKQADTH